MKQLINTKKPFIALFFAMMFWGLSFVWTKQLLMVFTPLLIIFFRLILSFLILSIFAKFSKKLQKIEKTDYWFLILVSIMQPFLYFIFEGYGIQNSTASVASILIATIPLFTLIGAYFLFREKLSLMNMIGIVISFSGVILIVAEFGSKDSSSMFGIVMLFMAVITGAAYGLGLKKLTEKYNSITITTYQNFIGIVLFLPLILIFEWKNLMHFPSLMNWNLGISLFNLALFASSIAFVLFTYGIQKIGPSKASAFSNSIPVFTLIFAYFILNEAITMYKFIGILIVLIGLFLSQIKK